jgi:hypothetical protein
MIEDFKIDMIKYKKQISIILSIFYMSFFIGIGISSVGKHLPAYILDWTYYPQIIVMFLVPFVLGYLFNESE